MESDKNSRILSMEKYRKWCDFIDFDVTIWYLKNIQKRKI